MNGWGQNGQISLFTEIYINLLLFRKYVGIYNFLGIRVWGTRVFHGTQVNSSSLKK